MLRSFFDPRARPYDIIRKSAQRAGEPAPLGINWALLVLRALALNRQDRMTTP